MLEIVVARCKKCGANFHGFTAEEALQKYKEHQCGVLPVDAKLKEVLASVANPEGGDENG